MNKKLLKIFGILLGVVTIVLAFCVFNQSVGYYESNMSYGGDAYTGIQNAAAQTANNVQYVGEMIRFALGSMMLVMGLAMLLGSLCIRTKEKAPVQAVVAPVAVDPVQKSEPKPAVPEITNADEKKEPQIPTFTSFDREWSAPKNPVSAFTDNYQWNVPKSPESVVYSQPAEKAPAGWKCTKCGTMVEDEGRFCYKCGRPKA